MSPDAFSNDALYDRLGLPEASLLDKRIFKRMVLEHGQLTMADKKTLSEDVTKLTWKYTLKAGTVQVLPYEDADREYLEVAVVEAVLSGRSRAPRIIEMIQRAIPYPVLLVMVEGGAFCVSVAHKRFSRAEKGSIVAEDFLSSPWIEQSLSDVDEAFCEALALQNLSWVDFYALYRSMVTAVLARACAELTGRFVLEVGQPEAHRKRRLEQCHELEGDISSLRVAIRKGDIFAEQVELNTRIKELEARLARTKADL
ncbi:MAG: hypothetical protein CL908_10965 [Deltaproteobacteria bacterium]|nr:hypothetical protein [Deltaproteobacteria bacterium]